MKRLRHPIRAIREPFGTAGLIVAMVALVAALGGTAFAAAKLNSTQKKEVEKIAKKYAGKPGAAGATGPAGPAGAAGAAGKEGPQGKPGEKGGQGLQGSQGNPGTPGTPGTDGKSVETFTIAHGTSQCAEQGGVELEVEGSGTATEICNGQTGFTTTLPEGKSEKGDWGGAATATANEQEYLYPISFNIPLETAPTPHLIKENGTTPSGCTGEVMNPGAQPGNLCVFVSAEENIQPFLGVFSFLNPQGNTNTAGTAGVMVVAESKAAGLSSETGTWAVTAPLAP